MSRRPRRNHSPAFKAKVALAAVKGSRDCCGQSGRPRARKWGAGDRPRSPI